MADTRADEGTEKVGAWNNLNICLFHALGSEANHCQVVFEPYFVF